MVHTKNNGLVQRAFKGETGFVASLDKVKGPFKSMVVVLRSFCAQACREFVNRNKACGAVSSKSPELLAKHTDALLKKSNKSAEEDDLETALSSTVRRWSRLTCLSTELTYVAAVF